MDDNIVHKSYLKKLRENVESILSSKSDLDSKPSINYDYASLYHELQVHQLELEMQNEELKDALEIAATATALYNFAPVGFFTLDIKGLIYQLNHRGADLLNSDSTQISMTDFKSFVNKNSISIFIEFLHRIFYLKEKNTCEIWLANESENCKYVHLEGVIASDVQKCLLTVTDITDRKLIEDALVKKNEYLEYFHEFTVDREIKMVELKKEINSLLLKFGEKVKY